MQGRSTVTSHGIARRSTGRCDLLAQLECNLSVTKVFSYLIFLLRLEDTGDQFKPSPTLKLLSTSSYDTENSGR